MVTADPPTFAECRPLGIRPSGRIAYDDTVWLLRNSRAVIHRSLRQFAIEELIIPEGKYRNTRLQIERQPWVGLLLDAIDSGQWRRTAVCGCVQSGKSLIGYVLPIIYYLFELGETVVCGVPTGDMAGDKWASEILPAIQASRYREFLPRRGPGSRGGTGNLTRIDFENGATLKFMSSHGGDEQRSSFTGRMASMTEVDKMDTAGEASREADPVTQIENRLSSYDEPERRVFLECTVSTKEGRIWQEYTKGTASKIVCPCPHCGEYVAPGREHLIGWKESETVHQAREHTLFACPECSDIITNEQRYNMNQRCRLIHRGQEIDAEGNITGDPPQTDTLGFRWNAFNNLFWSTAGQVGAKEWAALNSDGDNEEAEKELTQFCWATPYKPPKFALTVINATELRRRVGGYRKGEIPAKTKHLTMGVDVGKYVGWWSLIAWEPDGTGHVVEYGPYDVPSDRFGVERGILLGLRELREYVFRGWEAPGGPMTPYPILVDARYQPESVFTFCTEADSASRFLPAFGHGTGRTRNTVYSKPAKVNKAVHQIGEAYHIAAAENHGGAFAIHVDADYWKSWLHHRLAMERDASTGEYKPGAITLYDSPDRNEHVTFSKHITAEYGEVEFKVGPGNKTKWICKSRNNHLLDASYNACVAGHLAGVRAVRKPVDKARIVKQKPKPRPRKGGGLTTPDGRPFVASER